MAQWADDMVLSGGKTLADNAFAIVSLNDSVDFSWAANRRSSVAWCVDDPGLQAAARGRKSCEAGLGSEIPMSVDIALIDSGVNSGHFHVGWVAGGTAFSLGPNGDVRESTDYTDAIGHGTAVAAVIRERCPGARIHAVKIFTETLRAPVSLLIHGLEWAIDRNMKIIHLSLGTEGIEGRDRVVELCRTACVRRLVVLASARSPDDEVYPSCLDTVIGVYWHPECDADDLIYDSSHPIPFGASGYPRPLPGVPPESNFRGPSFAVARVTARVACLLEQNPDADPDWVRERLREMGARAGVSPNRRVPKTQESL